MRKSCIVVAALALLTGTTAMAGDKQADDSAKAEKKVCRSEGVTGSLARVNKICMTKSEWNELARKTKADIDDIQRNQGAVAPAAKGPFG